MNDKCPCCGQDLKLEPSFYEGAMYVSYAFQVALFVTVYVAYQMLYPEVGVAVQIGTLVALVLLLFSLILRLSRTLWIHFFIKANPAKAKCSEGQSRAPLPA